MSPTILGIDPGYGRMGWGVIAWDQNQATLLDAQCVETQAKTPYLERLTTIYDSVVHLIDQYQPDAMAVESLFFNTNAKTVILASQARGVILLAGAQAGIPLFDYTPLQVKQALVGYGRGDKTQVQEMLKFHMKLAKLPTQDDACDALAVALTHAYTNQKLIR